MESSEEGFKIKTLSEWNELIDAYEDWVKGEHMIAGGEIPERFEKFDKERQKGEELIKKECSSMKELLEQAGQIMQILDNLNDRLEALEKEVNGGKDWDDGKWENESKRCGCKECKKVWGEKK